MNNHDMMRNAAKAAGAKRTDYPDRTPDRRVILHADGIWREWDPENNGGDAFDMANSLRLTIAWEPSRGGWSVGAIVAGEFAWLSFGEHQRRAILCAAAVLGSKL